MRYIKEGYLRAVLQGGTQLTLNLINEIFKAEPKSSILIGILKRVLFLPILGRIKIKMHWQIYLCNKRELFGKSHLFFY